MNQSPVPSSCPQCGQTIPENSLQGLCPRCLMANAMAATEPAPAHAPPPETLADLASVFPQLQLLEYIGGGGMGRVYKARQPHLDRIVALKVLPPEMGADTAFAERFVREGKALAKLTHPNIVTVYDFGQAGRYFYLIMEYVDGVNLRQAMRNGLTPSESLTIVPKVCEALQFAHDHGVLHRDIKPENILIDTRGHVKIADFGIAKLGGEGQSPVTLTQSGMALGTPHYMAPEQIENAQEVDHRADIYSLGVVFYEMLTGGLPIGRFPAPSLKSGTDPRLDEVVFRTLEKEREKRYQSAGEMKTQVETAASYPMPRGIAPAVPASAKGTGPLSKKALWGFVLSIIVPPLFCLTMLGLRSASSPIIGSPATADLWVGPIRSTNADQVETVENQLNLLAYLLTLPNDGSPGRMLQLQEVESQLNQFSAPNEETARRVTELHQALGRAGAENLRQQSWAGTATPVRGMMMLLFLLMPLGGMTLGFLGLSDIQRSLGIMRGAGLGTVAAGLLPSAALVALGAGAGTLLQHGLDLGFNSGNVAIVVGMCGGGWLAFLFLRHCYRRASCWVPAAILPSTEAAVLKSRTLGQMALWFSIAGTICLLLHPMTIHGLRLNIYRAMGLHSPMLWVSLGLLITGVVLGFLSGHDHRGKAARILSTIMLVIFLITVL